MARLLPQVLLVFAGDRPGIHMAGSVPHVSVDGGAIGPALSFTSLDELEGWADQLAHDVAMHRARLREELADDDAYDRLCAGSAA